MKVKFTEALCQVVGLAGASTSASVLVARTTPGPKAGVDRGTTASPEIFVVQRDGANGVNLEVSGGGGLEWLTC